MEGILLHPMGNGLGLFQPAVGGFFSSDGKLSKR
jgi:hypothetical protein